MWLSLIAQASGFPEVPQVWNALIIAISGIIVAVLAERRGRRSEKQEDATDDFSSYEKDLFTRAEEQLASLRIDFQRVMRDRQHALEERDRLIERVGELQEQLAESAELARICMVENSALLDRVQELEGMVDRLRNMG